jgi:hypothetical protein
MKIFNKYHEKRTDEWYFQWGSFTHYENALLGIELSIPRPKDKSFFFGITLFYTTLFFFEIAKMDKPKPEYLPDGWK